MTLLFVFELPILGGSLFTLCRFLYFTPGRSRPWVDTQADLRRKGAPKHVKRMTSTHKKGFQDLLEPQTRGDSIQGPI